LIVKNRLKYANEKKSFETGAVAKASGELRSELISTDNIKGIYLGQEAWKTSPPKARPCVIQVAALGWLMHSPAAFRSNELANE
jgi:hypothetical protein